MPLIYACIASHVGDLIDEANSLGPTLGYGRRVEREPDESKIAFVYGQCLFWDSVRGV